MNQQSLIRKLAELGTFFGIEFSEPRMLMYAEEMQEWSDELVDLAIAKAKHHCKFFPSFAGLLELTGAKFGCQARKQDGAFLRYCQAPVFAVVGKSGRCRPCFEEYRELISHDSIKEG
ncbi:MAG: hypothetical protein ACPGYT_11795 [Nitrospirales bacterium]